MYPTRLALVALLMMLSVLHGCSRSPLPSTQPSATADASVAEPAASKPLRACDLITQAEMSAILGSAVTAGANDRSNGKTECIYTPVEGISPYVEFAVEWGSGEAAMTGAGMLGQAEPGIANPFEGLGDQAVAVGPALMIRTGDDLVTLVFSGVQDTPAKAKQIFDVARARM
jgi:hypothetical protein